MNLKPPPVTALQLAELVALDAATGTLTWKARDSKWFRAKRPALIARAASAWNAQNAGVPAFAHSSGAGYLHGSLFGVKFLAHRIVWTLAHGEWPKAGIDHINGNRRDNRPENLRDVPHRENCRNQPRSRANTSGVTGVSLDRLRGRYEAYINVEGKKVSLGRFGTVTDAANARRAANEAHGFHPNHGRDAA